MPQSFRSILRSPIAALATFIIAVGTALSSPAGAAASTSVEIFNSTNLPTYASSSLGARSGTWWAYKFTALQTTTVTQIDAFIEDSTDYGSFFAHIGTDYNSGSLGTLTPTTAETGLTCAGQACDRLTFSGSISLTAGNDYWIWIGSNTSTFIRLKQYSGAAATTSGLALGYTFATSDVKSSDGTVVDSSTNGYPWIKMYHSSSITPGAAPVRTVELSFVTSGGAHCEDSSVSATEGAWVRLPESGQCSPPGDTAGSLLLGWATNAGFPIAIAQRQIDNGWGAYETFDDNGQITGVFIPAGGYAHVTDDTNLYPIWSR